MIWGNGNLTSDPLFVDGGVEGTNYFLTENSPCIDSGDPDLDGDGSDFNNDQDDLDPDGTRMDIGAYYFDQGLVVSISTNISFETNSTSIPIQISFNDQPVGFTESSFELSNCTISGFESVTNLLYTFNLVPVSDGLLSMNLPEELLKMHKA